MKRVIFGRARTTGGVDTELFEVGAAPWDRYRCLDGGWNRSFGLAGWRWSGSEELGGRAWIDTGLEGDTQVLLHSLQADVR